MEVNWALNSQSRRFPGQPAHLPGRRSNDLRHLGCAQMGAVRSGGGAVKFSDGVSKFLAGTYGFTTANSDQCKTNRPRQRASSLLVF
jgi:hypothetical protein